MMVSNRKNNDIKIDVNYLHVVKPKSRYTLAELLERCDASVPTPKSLKPWVLMKEAGKELV